jgi:hypothetical protein
MIFEEVNLFNDTFQHIDLSCLDTNDCIPIAKQKIYDMALEIDKVNKSYLQLAVI